MKLSPILFTAILAGQLSAAPDSPNPGLKYYYPVPAANPAQVIEADICVYGGTPGGVSAAVQAARMGKKAVLFVMRRHVGGMTSGGLTATDIGNRKAVGGFANELYAKIGTTHGFRPSQAEEAFLHFLKEAGVTVHYEHRLKEVTKEGNRITSVSFENGNSVKARMFVDSTYEGDLFAKAGVSHHIGRESNATYGETINGVQFRNSHNFNVKVDPYKTPGDPSSGLLPGISAADPGKSGDGDRKIQAYNFRFQLWDGPDRIPFPKPDGYDRGRFALYERYVNTSANPPAPFRLRNGDCNNVGGFSTDHIGANYAWPEADYETREKIFQDHVNYQKGLAYFAANDPEVPQKVRDRVNAYGLMPGEFPETGGFPHELYVREGRRMVSDHVMTEAECRSMKVAEDSVGLAAYTMDSHNCQRVVIDGAVRNEGDVQVRVVRPYPLSYRSIVPKEAECANLLVSVCLSSSHIAYGSIRMEPVFMILGQSAATAASLAIDGDTSVQKVSYARLRERLLADKQILSWDAPPLSAEETAPAPEGIEVDDTAAAKTGAWSEAASGGYLHDANKDKGKKSITYTPNLPKDGNYDVYLTWKKTGNRATNVPVEINGADGRKSVKVDQCAKGGWVKIHSGPFKAGKSSSLTISNEGTDGHVIADAVRWSPAN
ncbi:MAG: FAD-dependent oxidoreductase [Verrucomicrobiaceae bacterium]|nr:MAG: FAD-dependent oxidoreductase [Verrucomicrobiaceae bacterium]